MSVLDNFEEWKGFLQNRLEQAEKKGIDNNMVTELATELGDYLSTNVDPKNNEERVLSDLWKVANEDERHAIASSMVKLVQKEG